MLYNPMKLDVFSSNLQTLSNLDVTAFTKLNEYDYNSVYMYITDQVECSLYNIYSLYLSIFL